MVPGLVGLTEAIASVRVSQSFPPWLAMPPLMSGMENSVTVAGRNRVSRHSSENRRACRRSPLRIGRILIEEKSCREPAWERNGSFMSEVPRILENQLNGTLELTLAFEMNQPRATPADLPLEK